MVITYFLFLPLSHIAERVHNVAIGITIRATVNFCSSFDQIMVELPEIQPTILLCVPRVWEKMMEGVQRKLGSAPPAKESACRMGSGCRTSIQ